MFFMKYKKPEDINVFFLGQHEFPEDVRETINAVFRDIAFYIFTLIDNGYNKIGNYKTKIEHQKNNMLADVQLYYMERCIFELKECNSGKWMVINNTDPETLQTFLYLIDDKFDI